MAPQKWRPPTAVSLAPGTLPKCVVVPVVSACTPCGHLHVLCELFSDAHCRPTLLNLIPPDQRRRWNTALSIETHLIQRPPLDTVLHDDIFWQLVPYRFFRVYSGEFGRVFGEEMKIIYFADDLG